MSRIGRLGVIGAGVMGAGLAENAAAKGLEVVLVDISEEILKSCKTGIQQSLRFKGMFNKQSEPKSASPPDEIIEKIRFTTDYAEISKVDFLVENATEKIEIKKEVYRCVGENLAATTVIAANTSCFSITRLGSLIPVPERLLGIHFMNPVPMKKTVEMIRGHWTTEQTITTAREFLAQLGKQGILVNDSPGFVSNRVLMLTINEAVLVLQDGVSTAGDVDEIFKSCFGHQMGPLETADLIGLDTILYSIEVLHESFADSKYRPAPLLKRMVDAGLLGRKSNAGFYNYGRKVN